MDSIFMDLMADEKARTVFEPFFRKLQEGFGGGEEEKSEAAQEAVSDDMGAAMMNYMPLRGLMSFNANPEVIRMVEQLLAQLNS